MFNFKGCSWAKTGVTLIVAAGIVVVVTGVRALFRPVLEPVKARVVSGRMLGALDARVRIVEFTDFQCPACANAARWIHDEINKNGANIFLELKYFPWPNHKNGRRAAVAAECALQQDKFWPMHNVLFQGQNDWAMLEDPSDHFLSLARGVGLDDTRMMRCMVRTDVDARISADVAEGEKLGVAATPTFFVNGKVVVGLGNLQLALKEALK